MLGCGNNKGVLVTTAMSMGEGDVVRCVRVGLPLDDALKDGMADIESAPYSSRCVAFRVLIPIASQIMMLWRLRERLTRLLLIVSLLLFLVILLFVNSNATCTAPMLASPQ